MEHISEEHFLFPQAPPTHPKHIQLIQGIFHTSPLTSLKFSRYNIHRDSISDAVFCGYGGIGRRARFRFWWQQPCRFKSCHPHQCRNGLRSIQKARLRPGFSHTTPSFLLLRKKSRLARLLSCKRTLTTARCRCQLFAGTWVQIFLKKTEFFCLTFTHLL